MYLCFKASSFLYCKQHLNKQYAHAHFAKLLHAHAHSPKLLHAHAQSPNLLHAHAHSLKFKIYPNLLRAHAHSPNLLHAHAHSPNLLHAHFWLTSGALLNRLLLRLTTPLILIGNPNFGAQNGSSG